jgi:hypothetical protein
LDTPLNFGEGSIRSSLKYCTEGDLLVLPPLTVSLEDELPVEGELSVEVALVVGDVGTSSPLKYGLNIDSAQLPK